MFGRAALGVLGVFSLCDCVCLEGQINSWTNPASGAWEDMHWSQGMLPGPGQVVSIENPGWKAVAIGSSTVQNFPQSLRPWSISISSPTNSYNVLLLNYAGLQTPLSVQALRIYDNAALITLSSALEVHNNDLSIGGTLNQGDFSTVSANTIQLGDIGPGAYNLTNGTLIASTGLNAGGNFPAHFNQFDGSNYTGNVQLFTSGEYNMFGGSLTTSNIIYRSQTKAAGSFTQYGGFVKPEMVYVTQGAYILAGGTLSSSEVLVPGVAFFYDVAGAAGFLQTGGTNFTTLLNIGTWPQPYMNVSPNGAYTLSNGVLVTSSSVLGPFGGFQQSGGIHVTDSLALDGNQTGPMWASYGTYVLEGGSLSTRRLDLGLGDFTQSGGTNQVTGDLTVTWRGSYNSTFQLSGGLLHTSNATIVSNPLGRGGFTQSGGIQIVSNLLTVSRMYESWPSAANAYEMDFLLTGGQLIVPNIQVDSGASFHHHGGTLINAEMLTLANGNWEANANQQAFGKLLLGVSQANNSSIVFPNGPTSLNFANSSSVIWSNQAVLTIEHWNGSLAGGGLHQLFFGNGSNGLTAQQLAQIQFHDPAGTPGTYPASILSTGEVVPAQVLASKPIGNGLALSWGPGMLLQSSTNVTGPFQDITAPAATSYTVTFTEPRRFFRLRSAAKAQSVFAKY